VTAPTVSEPVDLRVAFEWRAGGQVQLDNAGKVRFAGLPVTAGLYRMTLTHGATGVRVYVGETDNLHQRLAGNYRNPGPSQHTSLRINALLCEHLAAGGVVELAVATTATVWLADGSQPLDLSRKAGRLLAENAALVLAQLSDQAVIINLG
jgi:hypothetical protein